MRIFEDIKGKKVLITGADGGLGSSMAKLFSEYGAHVGLHCLEKNGKALLLLKEVQEKGGKAELFQADFLDSEARSKLVPAFIQQFGRIDVLINNAGAIYDYRHFSELPETSWEHTFNLNVKAPFYLTASTFSFMKEQKAGRVLNISSVNVKYGGSAKSMHYVAAKAALDNLTLGFAKEGAPYNILVNSIRCGFIDTPMRKNTAGYSEQDMQKRIALIPLKRIGQPIDIASMALFLASESANFITGEIFTVAGGD